jgi:hypothetical protein
MLLHCPFNLEQGDNFIIETSQSKQWPCIWFENLLLSCLLHFMKTPCPSLLDKYDGAVMIEMKSIKLESLMHPGNPASTPNSLLSSRMDGMRVG